MPRTSVRTLQLQQQPPVRLPALVRRALDAAPTVAPPVARLLVELAGAVFDLTSGAATLTEADAARYVGMSVPYMRGARRRRRGPAFVQIGRAVRYLRADLDAWLAGRRVPPR